MDRKKLLRMIQRDLDELAEIADEMSVRENISALEVEFALGKSRIISQELDYLREMIHQQSLLSQEGSPDEQAVSLFPQAGPAAQEMPQETGDEYTEKKIVEFPVNVENFANNENPSGEPNEELDEELNEEPAGVAEEAGVDEEAGVTEEALQPDEPDENIPETGDEPTTFPEESLQEDEDQTAFRSQEEQEMSNNEAGPAEEALPQETPDKSAAETIRQAPEAQNEKAQDVKETTIQEEADKKEEVPQEEVLPLDKEYEHPEPQEPITVRKTVAEIFAQEKSINESLAATQSIDHKVSALPLSRLEQAIGLNDRFLFIRELFNNDAGLFNQAIRQIDQMQSLSEAVNFLNGNFKWKKNEASLKFAQLVKRRFAR